MSGKSQTVWEFSVFRPSQILPTNGNSNRRYPRSFGLNRDKSGESGAFLFSRRVPDFFDGRRSFATNENSNLYRRGRRRPSAIDFAHYQSPKLLGSSLPITNKHGVSQKHEWNRENLGQTSGECPTYRQNLGWSAKSKISDRLGFSRHMKTRLNRNAPDSPDLSPFIPNDRGYLRFRVFISWQNLGRSGNSKIPDRLGFSRHVKIRL